MHLPDRDRTAARSGHGFGGVERGDGSPCRAGVKLSRSALSINRYVLLCNLRISHDGQEDGRSEKKSASGIGGRSEGKACGRTKSRCGEQGTASGNGSTVNDFAVEAAGPNHIPPRFESRGRSTLNEQATTSREFRGREHFVSTRAILEHHGPAIRDAQFVLYEGVMIRKHNRESMWATVVAVLSVTGTIALLYLPLVLN